MAAKGIRSNSAFSCELFSITTSLLVLSAWLDFLRVNRVKSRQCAHIIPNTQDKHKVFVNFQGKEKIFQKKTCFFRKNCI